MPSLLVFQGFFYDLNAMGMSGRVFQRSAQSACWTAPSYT